MRRLGLAGFASRTGPGLDAQLTPAEQATRQSPDRQFGFAQLLVNLINQGAFGPLCGTPTASGWPGGTMDTAWTWS
jgi:hypothetical protein